MSCLTSAPVQTVEAKSSLVLEVPRSLGEVAVVPPTASPQQAYDRALSLMSDTRKQIASVASVKGPTATPSLSDTWLAKNDAIVALPAILSVISSVVSLIAGAASDGSVTVSMYAGAFAAANLLPIPYLARAETRLKKAREKHAAELLETSDLDRMLTAVRAATPAERGMIEPFLKEALRPLDEALSAKAAMARDRLMENLPAPQGATARAAQLATIVDDLLNGHAIGTRLDALHRLFLAAPADELPVMAANLEAAVFRGERAIVAGDQQEVRAVYALIQGGLRGEVKEQAHPG